MNKKMSLKEKEKWIIYSGFTTDSEFNEKEHDKGYLKKDVDLVVAELKNQLNSLKSSVEDCIGDADFDSGYRQGLIVAIDEVEKRLGK